jgi:preprotein translocase subunit SecA
MFNIFKKFFDYNQRELDKLQQKVAEINALEDKVRVLKDEDFKKETEKFKEQIQSGQKTLNEILPWAFALVRETSRRILGERHFDEQIMAAIALHQGKVVEQKTGEGKTLSATAPLYLNALSGKGAHLVTVNDYLARRDTGWMGQIYHFLGLSTSAIISDQSFLYDPNYRDEKATDWRLIPLKPISRKEAYQSDITYGINSEFGFDYLRDNMNYSIEDLVQRGFYYAIIDEVDSVLIDEARTPHIISAPYEEDTSKYYQYAKIVKQLNDRQDYIIDEKSRTAHLTEKGVLKIEKILGVSNIYEKDFDTLFHVEAALKAMSLFKKDKDYIVKDDEVIIVDEFTGRLLHGRRFSEGLHQAIEAKENVSIKRESKTLATVSLQNYFRMYKKLAGMTGTAATEAEEFSKIYKLDTVVVPTHKKMIREDCPDMIYKTEKGKFKAVAEEIIKNYQKGRPILVGTTSIEKNEHLSRILKQKRIPHELLNAKNHEREALIISNAGKKGAVTVATNMAGRGVDIILGGEPPNKFKVDQDKEYEKQMGEWRKKHDEIVSLGGLYVIGTERHESRRIDNQLRGRAGRQGDPGETRFFVSLEDDLMRIFGGEQVSKLMTFFKIPEDQPLTHSMVSKTLEQAQIKVEGFNFDIRKHLVDFDDVLNKQREIVYGLRKKILINGVIDKQEEFNQIVFEVFKEEISNLTNLYLLSEVALDFGKLINEFVTIIPLDRKKLQSDLKAINKNNIQDFLEKQIEIFYKKKEKEFGQQLWLEVVKDIYLTTIDKYWMDHLTAVEDLREGINLRGYAQLDPLVEYKNEAFSMFERLLTNINYELSRRVLKIEISKEQPAIQREIDENMMRFQSASGVNPFSQQQSFQQSPASSHLPTLQESQKEEQTSFRIIAPGTKRKKIGRNDPCWCGAIDPTTGKPKKYKKCHYPN